jgi:predicted  nucleic acid-binding Zn-ribbon protein
MAFPSVFLRIPGTGIRYEVYGTLLVDEGTEVHETGELAQVGSLSCVECGYSISLELSDELPSCPACGGSSFRRASMFESPTVDADAISAAPKLPAWLDEIRESLKAGEQFVAFADGDEPVVTELQDGWTRIGRSGSADIQLDDATVSRRHALIVRTREDELRALDDRSLNGLFINGERVEWAPLIDGDELEIGRYRLYVIQT